jgi:hypothetical protein
MLIEIEPTCAPSITKWHVRCVLRWLSADDLEGLQSIKVIADCPDDPEYSNLKPFLRGVLYNGHYSRKVKDRPAQVVLYARDIYYGIPRLFLASPIATLKLARTLAHEVAHHVIATRGYIHKPWEKYKPWDGTRDPYEEMIADTYASNVVSKMKNHWPYKLGELLSRMLSHILFKAGIQEYWDGNYQSSADLEFRAHSLNPENDEAGQCYRHAMEQLRKQIPSPLTPSEKKWLAERYDPTPIQTAMARKRQPSNDNEVRRPGRTRKRRGQVNQIKRTEL